MPKNDAATPARSVTMRIHEAYSGLSEGERQIADVVLEAPAELAVVNAGELARRAGVSNSTVSRFFRRLDYRSFEEARQDARALRATGSPLYTGRSGSSGRDPISRLLAEDCALIEATLSRANPLTLREIARAAARAPRVRTVGFRNSRFLAEYLTAQLTQMCPGVAPLHLPGQTQAEGIAALGPEDLVVVVGLRRRPNGFARLVEAIAAQEARVLLLADQTVREAPAHATWTLDCVVETPHFADSYVGAMSLLRLLVLEVRRALGERGNAHLARVEALRDRLDELE